MKTIIVKLPEISPAQSVICILGTDLIPEHLGLSKAETEYALKRLKANDEHVFINSYNKCTYLVKLKDSESHNKTRELLRRTGYNLRNLIRSNNHSELVITSESAYREAVTDLAEGLLLSFYKFSRYKTAEEKGEKKNYPDKLLLHGDISNAEVDLLTHTIEAVYFTRDMINEPVNQLNATVLSEEIKKMGSSAGFRVEVLNKGKIESLKMGGLLAVNRGSVDPPVFSILEWHPENSVNKKPIVLVGKGVVYDTGGLNLKTGDFMDGMKGDMAGAATVTAVMYTAAKTGIPLHIIGLIPSTDNRPGEMPILRAI
jgi:leucyl aminopeptidase